MGTNLKTSCFIGFLLICAGFYDTITSFKEKGVWIALALGGWNDSTEKYSKMLDDSQHRANVVAQISSFLRTHKFQGLDLDIEYPAAYQVQLKLL